MFPATDSDFYIQLFAEFEEFIARGRQAVFGGKTAALRDGMQVPCFLSLSDEIYSDMDVWIVLAKGFEAMGNHPEVSWFFVDNIHIKHQHTPRSWTVIIEA
jgi:hypothetical protein